MCLSTLIQGKVIGRIDFLFFSPRNQIASCLNLFNDLSKILDNGYAQPIIRMSQGNFGRLVITTIRKNLLVKRVTFSRLNKGSFYLFVI